ncbi:sugar kinase [Dongia mobilis]|uniref:sugar kinase n=1 Tax=Dongia sp. TaxID=1977262 RepID=UPI0026EDCBD6
MKSIASIGECMVEFAPDGNGAWRMGFAGDTFNTLWTLRGLLPATVRTDYVSAFGDDDFSRRQLAFFADHGIGTAESPCLKGGRPGLYAITLDGHERSFTYWRSDAVARRLADDPSLLLASLARRDLIYFSGITLAILAPPARALLMSALTEARAAGSRLAFDPNYRARLWPGIDEARIAITAALQLADIALPTHDDEKQLFGDTDPDATVRRLLGHKVPEFVVKDGGNPALLGTASGVEEISAVKPVQLVDTSGAGDAFNGAYLSARLQGQKPSAAAMAAHRVASVAIGVRGALTPFDKLAAARQP